VALDGERHFYFHRPGPLRPPPPAAFLQLSRRFVSAVDQASGRTIWRVNAESWESLGVSADGRKSSLKAGLAGFPPGCASARCSRTSPVPEAPIFSPASRSKSADGSIRNAARTGLRNRRRRALRPDPRSGRRRSYARRPGRRWCLASNVDGLLVASSRLDRSDEHVVKRREA